MTINVTLPKMEEHIRAGIKARINEIIEDEAKQASERILKRVRGEADSLALRLLRHYSVMSYGDRIVIEVKKDG